MDTVQSFCKDTHAYIKEIGVSLKGKGIVVALSGGADSVGLLRVLHLLKSQLGCNIYALHLNHMIRGEEADRDEAFCATLCDALGVPFKAVKVDVPSISEATGKSLELCGRDCRYEALNNYCFENGIDYIATAHNANDRAETVLYNLVRGSGAEGLRGIPKLRGNIIRPILGMEKQRIFEFLGALGQDYVTDSTNFENDFTRNYIRNVILPACFRINSDVVSAINRASCAVDDDCAYLEGLLGDFTDKDSLCELPIPLRIRAIKRLYSQKYGDGLESCHINALLSALEGNGQRLVSLPKAVTARVYGGKISFFYVDEKSPSLEKTLICEGNNSLANGAVTVKIGYGKDFDVKLNAESIVGSLVARPRAEGDKICIRGINRSVKKVFIDKKIPPSVRALVPIICDDEGIIYVPHVGVADRVYPKKGDSCVGISVVIDERVGIVE